MIPRLVASLLLFAVGFCLADPPVASSTRQNDERMAILAAERAAVVAALAKASDPTKEARLKGDLAALDREIASVSRSAARPVDVQTGQVKPKPPSSSPAPASQENQDFEPWDIFKNFGKK